MPDQTDAPTPSPPPETPTEAASPALTRLLAGRSAHFWIHLVAILLVAGAAVAHQAVFWGWYIEDAAISFAFARNWAWGEGLVAFPGGERTEGYSNPTWVALLAFFELFGADSFDTSKIAQAVLAFLTVPLTYFIAREASPDPRSHAPLFAAGYLATAATYAIWGACGLENALFGFILAAALLRSAIDIRTESFPYAAFLWFLLAITRPEAILYCAIAGLLTLIFTARRGVMPTIYWLLLFYVPFGLYHAVRYQYFAYEFPQTYYGKMTLKEPKPFSWNTRGWRYVRNWSHELWTGYFLPIWFFGLVGSKGIRGWLTALAVAIAGFALLFPDIVPAGPVEFGGYEVEFWGAADLPRPRWIQESRSYLLIGIAFTLPLFALLGERGWQVRLMCWGIASAVFFFAIYTLGDWMKAWRWMSLLQVPAAVLFGIGVGELAGILDRVLRNIEDVVQLKYTGTLFWCAATLIAVASVFAFGDRFVLGQWGALGIVGGGLLVAFAGSALDRGKGVWTLAGWTVASLLMVTAILPNITHTRAQKGRPETGPFSIRTRVDFVSKIKETADLDGRIVDLDVDQGAHLWWGRDRFSMMDIAGLVDIPLAQHRFARAFIHEYVFEEMKPHYAHVHGGWASNSRIPTHPEWKSDYLEIPGYPAGRTQFHIGNYIRRDLVMQPEYEGPNGRRVEFEGDVVVEGFEVPSEPTTGKVGLFEIAVRDRATRKKGEDLQLTMFAAQDGAVVASWNIPLGYGWFAANEWRKEEVFVGKHKLPVPKAMEPGVYDLGLVLTAPSRQVLRADPDALDDSEPNPLPAGAYVGGRGTEALFADGEVVFPGMLTVVDDDTAATLATEDRDAALALAEALKCEESETRWRWSRYHKPADKKYAKAHRPEINRALAACWVGRSGQEPERAIDYLEKARIADHHAPAYLAAKDAVADPLYEAGRAAMEQQDWEAAYRSFSDTLRVDKTRSWARRYAEVARGYRLGIDRESLLEEKRKKKERIDASKERNKKAAKEREERRREKEEANKAAKEEDAEDEGGKEPLEDDKE